MSKDEQSIRQWFERWMKSTKLGDLPLARTLIADDAVFLVPGAVAGHSLSILKREGDGWVVIRDANTMAPVQ